MLDFVRAVSICLVGVCACFVLGSNAGRDEKPDPISLSPVASNSPTRARNHTFAPEQSKFKLDKNNESRTLSGERVVAQISKELPDTSLALGLKISPPSFHGITSALKRLSDAEIDEAMEHVTILLKKKNWRDLMETTDIPWEVDDIRKKVFSHCLGARESPAHTFRYMKVQLMTTDTQEYDPKLLWWFDYVKKYRRLSGVGMIETAKSDTATSHGVFDDKELFAFLVNKYDVQMDKDMSSTVFSLKTTPPDSRQQVVALFEWLRHQSKTKKLAEGMQLYMVSMSNTKQLEFREWLQGRVSPKTIFDILRLRSGDNEGMFLLWLKYVDAYWSNVAPGSNHQYFYYDDFLRLLTSTSSWDNVTRLLNSKLFYQVFDKVSQHGFGTHARNLLALWTEWLWLRLGASPRDFFEYLHPSGKFELGDLKFMQGVFYASLYRMEKQFTNRDLFDLLSEKHSSEEIVGLFRWLQEQPGMEELANGMLKYLTHPSIRQDPHVTQILQREGHLPQKKQRRTP